MTMGARIVSTTTCSPKTADLQATGTSEEANRRGLIRLALDLSPRVIGCRRVA